MAALKSLGYAGTGPDGNSYLDYGLAWGPLILGHSHPKVVEAVQRQAGRVRRLPYAPASP